MKTIGMLIIVIAIIYGDLPVSIVPRMEVIPMGLNSVDNPLLFRTPLPYCTDISGGGKNIIVCRHGEVLASLYREESIYSRLKIAYSVDSGISWTTYGPFSENTWFPCPSCDGMRDFCSNPGKNIFIYLDRQHSSYQWPVCVIVEENTPFAPSPSAPIILTLSESLRISQPGIAYAPDSDYIIAWGWSYIPDGNIHTYVWSSYEGGYIWPQPIDIGVIVNPGYGGNSGAKLRMGTGGYIAGIYNNSVGGIVNDGWPHFVESTDGGQTWLPPITLPVPYFDSSASQFWWNEMDCEVINDKPFAVFTDLGIDSLWLFIDDGTPGNRIWTVKNIRQLGACSLIIDDMVYYCYPSRYPNVSYEPTTNTILISYKAYYYKSWGDSVWYDGAHIGGVYSTDNGLTWRISEPLSEQNTGQIPWNNWSATETAYNLSYNNGDVLTSAVWANSNSGSYLERGRIRPFLPTGIVEQAHNPIDLTIKILPSISRHDIRISFVLPKAEKVLLSIYDVTGRMIDIPVSNQLSAGPHTIATNIQRLPAGTYFVCLKTDRGSAMKKVLKIK